MVYVIRRKLDDFYLKNYDRNEWSSKLTVNCWLTKEQVQEFMAFQPHLNDYLIYTVVNPNQQKGLLFLFEYDIIIIVNKKGAIE